MIYKCKYCGGLLTPRVYTREQITQEYTYKNMSAEKAMHLTNNNYHLWLCTSCNCEYYSEIERKVYGEVYSKGKTGYNYISRKKALRKKRDD